MRAKSYLFVCWFLSFVSLFIPTSAMTAPIAASPDQELYWLSFTTAHGIRLMQIDSLGNVVRPSKRIVSSSRLGGLLGGTALSNRSRSKLIIWIPSGDESKIKRITVDKRTFGVISIRQTDIESPSGFIQSTQKTRDNFLAVQTTSTDGQILKAFGISDKYLPNGKEWLLSSRILSPPSLCRECSGGVASDGRSAFLITEPIEDLSKVFVQPLGVRGRPKNDPAHITSLRNSPGGFRSADSAGVGGSHGYVIYVEAPESNGGLLSEELFLQVFASSTGSKIGGKILVSSIDMANGEAIPVGQNIAIDPLGRFLIFVVHDQLGVSQIKFQALDVFAHPSGAARVLVKSTADLGSVDLLRE